MSPAFPRRDGELHAEGVSLARLADAFGTPLYVYSASRLAENHDALDAAFSGVPHSICFSIKTNLNPAVARVLVARGAGVDVTSAGELFLARQAGAAPERCVFSGVGKAPHEIDAALEAGIRLFNLESRAELRRVDALAAARGVAAPVAFRVNPDVDARTHPYIATGLRTSKFGIPIGEALDAYAEAKALDHVRVVGVDCHIGSQITSLEPFGDALARVARLVGELRAAGHAIELVDVGGGLGVTYDAEAPPAASDYAAVVRDALGGLGCEILLEPGRSIAADAGVLVTRVLYEKDGEERRFAIVDAGMNDLLRPALYQAHHRIEPVGPPRGPERAVDVVGPVCESADCFARDRRLPALEAGDLLAFQTAGAYGHAMASNYNGRPRAAEVMVRGERYALIRQRETLEDLVRGVSIPRGVTDPEDA